jgi:5-methyltetrahydrofolate--homocysteine methyltransferase
MNHSEILANLQEKVIKGKIKEIEQLCVSALEEGLSAMEILEGGLLMAMQRVADAWKNGTAFIPEVLITARGMNLGLAVLEPHLVLGDRKNRGKVVIGTVLDDQHDIGKNLISLMLKSRGFEIIDLGVNVKPEKFVEAIKLHQPEVLCMSALLTTSMIHFREVIRALEEANLRENLLICVGGAPVTQAYAQQVTADVYTPDAVSLADLLAARFA